MPAIFSRLYRDVGEADLGFSYYFLPTVDHDSTNFRREFLELRSFLCIQRNEVAIAAQEIEIVAHSSKMTESQEIPDCCSILHSTGYTCSKEGGDGGTSSTFPNLEGNGIFVFDSRSGNFTGHAAIYKLALFFVFVTDRCLPRGSRKKTILEA
jgi:hypothetical protein